MPKIRVLDESLINKIAAGEVVERPASVVKELVENSIDADAKKIFVEVREAGRSLIRVTDDGNGMDSEDALLSVQRHATSKIQDADDLFNIHSLGFRGEALASIAAVSMLWIKTKAGRQEGVEIEVAAGELLSRKKVVMPRGTIVTVKGLFFNVPVRKKHLKTIQTELRLIVELVTRYALINPDIYFELVHNDKVIINSPNTTDTTNNIASIYGRNVAGNVLAVNYSSGDIEIMGSISKPGFQRNDHGYQSIFINGRYVKNRLINDAVYEGYHTFLNINKHPVYILDISINPSKIDVNVHPQKSRIRLEKEADVYVAVVNAVQQTLTATEQIPTVKKIKKQEFNLKLDNYKINREKQVFLQEKKIQEKKKPVQDFKILGQILRTYVVVATKEGMLLVDQHAAQERVNYERFMRQFNEMRVRQQELLEPLVIELNPAERIVIEHNRELIQKLGFGIEGFGKNSFLLRKTPMIFERLQGRDIFLSVLDELRKEKTTKLDKVKEERIIRKACRASIKANQQLEITELIDVINDLLQAEQPYTCPHGRPTMIKFTANELEKMFKRKL